MLHNAKELLTLLVSEERCVYLVTQGSVCASNFFLIVLMQLVERQPNIRFKFESRISLRLESNYP